MRSRRPRRPADGARSRVPLVTGIERVATFASLHGGGDVGWYWHLVEEALRSDGNQVVAPEGRKRRPSHAGAP